MIFEGFNYVFIFPNKKMFVYQMFYFSINAFALSS